MTERPEARAGQIWRAPAPRVHGGYRYVQIESVRGNPDVGHYALVREVWPDGRRKGKTRAWDSQKGEWFDWPPFQTVLRGGTLQTPYEFVTPNDASASS